MPSSSEPKCHTCGLHTDVCLFFECLTITVRKATEGNFQFHLATATIKRFIEPRPVE